MPAEALHSTAPSEELVTTLTLTAGSTAGVKRYSPVVAPEGLVGTIQTADPTMSIAILYTHPDFRASAMTADGIAFGIVYPHAQRGERQRRLHARAARRADARSTSSPARSIYTSGLGGTFPRGIAIGTIVSELEDDRSLDAHVSRASGGDAVARDDGARAHRAARHAGNGQRLGRGDR